MPKVSDSTELVEVGATYQSPTRSGLAQSAAKPLGIKGGHPGWVTEIVEGGIVSYQPPVGHLMARTPWQQCDVGLPQGAHQDHAFIDAALALQAGEAQQYGVVHTGTGLLEHLPFHGGPPILMSFGVAAGKLPFPAAIRTDQHDVALRCDAGCRRAMGVPGGCFRRLMPGREPVPSPVSEAAVAADGALLHVSSAGYTRSQGSRRMAAGTWVAVPGNECGADAGVYAPPRRSRTSGLAHPTRVRRMNLKDSIVTRHS